jgi:hypothetical protein
LNSKQISPVGDMTTQQTIIVDLTRPEALICVVDPGARPLELNHQQVVPYRVAIRNDEADLRFLAGDKAANIREDGRTLIFDNLASELLRIEDEELQSELALAFWNEICETLLRQGVLKDSAESVKGYIIPHHCSPPDLLVRIRKGSAGNTPSIAGFCHEGICLVMGLLQTGAFATAISGREGLVPVCLFAADGNAIDVVCFDYLVDGDGRISILLRNYFRATSDDLFRRLKQADWLDTFSVLLLLESSNLSDSAKDTLNALLDGIWTDDVVKQRQVMPELPWLKALGAAYIASCCFGQAATPGEYNLQTAWHIGVRLDRDSFHPLVTRKQFEEARDFSYSALQFFKLRGRPGNEMRVQLYCGFSHRVEDSTLLGQLTLSNPELASLASDSESVLAAVLKLDTHGSGEFTLGLLPDDRIVSSMAFALPGLVI